MLNVLRRNRQNARLVQALLAALTAQSRTPALYLAYGVPDTIDGRFDMVALHAWLVFGRLKAAGMDDISRDLMKAIFVSFDEGLRDLGTGDMGLGPRMKALGLAFNGRLHAYEGAADEEAFADAILRNVYRGAEGHDAQVRALARYALGARVKLELSDPAQGVLDFGAVPATLV